MKKFMIILAAYTLSHNAFAQNEALSQQAIYNSAITTINNDPDLTPAQRSQYTDMVNSSGILNSAMNSNAGPNIEAISSQAQQNLNNIMGQSPIPLVTPNSNSNSNNSNNSMSGQGLNSMANSNIPGMPNMSGMPNIPGMPNMSGMPNPNGQLTPEMLSALSGNNPNLKNKEQQEKELQDINSGVFFLEGDQEITQEDVANLNKLGQLRSFNMKTIEYYENFKKSIHSKRSRN